MIGGALVVVLVLVLVLAGSRRRRRRKGASDVLADVLDLRKPYRGPSWRVGGRL